MPNFSFSRKKLLLVGFLFTILLVIPLTVYLVRQQQQTQSQAAPETTLTFNPASKTASKDDDVVFDVRVNPGGNWVNYIQLGIGFDSTKLEVTKDSFKINPDLGWQIFKGGEVSADSYTITFSAGIDATKVIKQDTLLGTISFKVIADSSDQPTEISFDRDKIQIRSVTTSDAFNENVFSDGASAEITIQEDVSPTPSVSPTVSVSPSITVSPTATPSPGVGGTNQSPICQSLVGDKTAQGAPPFSITYTANGIDNDGTISKVAFNFENDTPEELTTSGGIGTATVAAQMSHTFNNEGIFNVSAILTDDQDAESSATTCTATVTVASGSAQPSEIPATGPNAAILGAGALGGLLFLVGAFIFFIL